MTALLSDTDLANASVDLSSWLFQDDSHLQDFCYGAKDMHSTPSRDASFASPSFISCQDFPDWMESTNDIKWDEAFCFEKPVVSDPPAVVTEEPNTITDDYCVNPNDVIKEEIREQQRQQQLQFADEHCFLPVIEPEEKMYALDQGALETLVSDLVPDYNFSSEFSDVKSDVFVQPQQVKQATDPLIISVSLSEALSHKVSQPVPSPIVQQARIAQPVASPAVPTNTSVVQQVALPSSSHQQQPVVINLKTVRLVPKPEPEPPKQTLKDILTSDEADDFIKELVSLPSDIPSDDSSSNIHLMEDNSYADSSSDDGSSMQFLLSPHSDADEIVHEFEEVEEVVETKPAKSHRYAPYSSLEKKLRKKEQNKRAALRYRQKKKNEEESVLGAMRREEQKQKELIEKYNTVKMEVTLMKKLMKDMLIAKGKLIESE